MANARRTKLGRASRCAPRDGRACSRSSPHGYHPQLGCCIPDPVSVNATVSARTTGMYAPGPAGLRRSRRTGGRAHRGPSREPYAQRHTCCGPQSPPGKVAATSRSPIRRPATPKLARSRRRDLFTRLTRPCAETESSSAPGPSRLGRSPLRIHSSQFDEVGESGPPPARLRTASRRLHR